MARLLVAIIIIVCILPVQAFWSKIPCGRQNRIHMVDESVIELLKALSPVAFPIVIAAGYYVSVNNNVDKLIAAEREARREQNAAIDKQIAAEREARRELLASEKDARKAEFASFEKLLLQEIRDLKKSDS